MGSSRIGPRLFWSHATSTRFWVAFGSAVWWRDEERPILCRLSRAGFVDADGIEYTDIEVIVETDADIRDTVRLVKTLERPLTERK
jgi:hypothetical protein